MKNMDKTIPAATGANKVLTISVGVGMTPKAVMAVSPMTRPRVPASVASRPLGIKVGKWGTEMCEGSVVGEKRKEDISCTKLVRVLVPYLN